MATALDEKTINVIRATINLCRKQHSSPELVMCCESDMYYKALKSIRRVGMLGVELSILGIIITLFICFTTGDSMSWWEIAIYVVAIIALGQASLKLYEYKGTPISLFFCLILAAASSFFAMQWFLMIILIIFIIIAITRWTTYKSWFQDLKNSVDNYGDEHVFLIFMSRCIKSAPTTNQSVASPENSLSASQAKSKIKTKSVSHKKQIKNRKTSKNSSKKEYDDDML